MTWLVSGDPRLSIDLKGALKTDLEGLSMSILFIYLSSLAFGFLMQLSREGVVYAFVYIVFAPYLLLNLYFENNESRIFRLCPPGLVRHRAMLHKAGYVPI